MLDYQPGMGFNTLILIMAFFFFPIIEFTTLNWKQALSLNQLLCHAGLYHFLCITSSKIYPDKWREIVYIIVLNLKIITLGRTLRNLFNERLKSSLLQIKQRVSTRILQMFPNQKYQQLQDQ